MQDTYPANWPVVARWVHIATLARMVRKEGNRLSRTIIDSALVCDEYRQGLHHLDPHILDDIPLHAIIEQFREEETERRS